MFPSSLRSVTHLLLRCLRGKSLAVFFHELLQSFLKTLAAPFAGFRQDLTFQVSQTRQWLRIQFGFHQTTRLPCVAFMPVEEPLPLHTKDSVKMHPSNPC